MIFGIKGLIELISCRSCNYPLGIEITPEMKQVVTEIIGCRSCNYPLGIEILA